MVDAKGFEKGIVQLTSPFCGLALLAMNTFIPGSGTLISACLDKEKFNVMAVFLGILQFSMAILVIGWLWSIFHGYQIYAISLELSCDDLKQDDLMQGHRRNDDEAGIVSEASGSPI